MSRLELTPAEAFVASAPPKAKARDLAAVVGLPQDTVQRIRWRTPKGREGPHSFADLFRAWHGRAPEDSEWPVPAIYHGVYEWHAPELVLLVSLVGQSSTKEIADILTARLRSVTGNPDAVRTANAVKLASSRLGMLSSDVLGGILVSTAAKELGREHVIREAIDRGELRTKRVGRLLVIPHADWAAWKDQRNEPPAEYVQLSSLKAPLAIRSDKLSEFARMGYVPGAVLCHARAGDGSGNRGTWYIPPSLRDQLLEDRRAGRPMPWHGKPILDNLKAVWKRYVERRHPASCPTCAAIWGEAGAPREFDDFVHRYPPLAFGAKRHLTRVWSPGVSLLDAAKRSGRALPTVRHAIGPGGQLKASKHKGKLYVAESDLTLWIAAGAPAGKRATDWISLATAEERYRFSQPELQAMIADGRLVTRIEPAGPNRGQIQVPWRQARQLRDDLGFSEEDAAAKLGISIEQVRELAKGVNWRGQEGITLDTLNAMKKRLQSEEGFSVEQAAALTGRSVAWVESRVNDGTVRIYRASWSERRYITRAGLAALRRAAAGPRMASWKGEWLSGTQAAHLAAVSSTTLLTWVDTRMVTSRDTPRGRRYEADSVRAQARRYWATARSLRDKRPDWLRAEQPIYKGQT